MRHKHGPSGFPSKRLLPKINSNGVSDNPGLRTCIFWQPRKPNGLPCLKAQTNGVLYSPEDIPRIAIQNFVLDEQFRPEDGDLACYGNCERGGDSPATIAAKLQLNRGMFMTRMTAMPGVMCIHPRRVRITAVMTVVMGIIGTIS